MIHGALLLFIRQKLYLIFPKQVSNINVATGNAVQSKPHPAPVSANTDAPTHRFTPITNKVDESRSKLLSMMTQLDKYKCGKVAEMFIIILLLCAQKLYLNSVKSRNFI